MRTVILASCLSAMCVATAPAKNLLHTFNKIQATDQFWAEGAHIGDFNHDGKMDVVSGALWYAGPDFKVRHEIWPAKATFERKKGDGTAEQVPGFEGALGVNNAYSDCFLTYTCDFNGDGWMDVMVYGHPGTELAWYENPKNAPGPWPRHVVFDVLDNESPGFEDVTGDGKPEVFGCSKGYLGYLEVNWKSPAQPWTWRSVSPKGDYQRYTHGVGVGDINGDGLIDMLDKDAWWEHPAKWDNTTPWKRHPFPFAKASAQMLVYDVNADGMNDVITAHSAHEYGLSWFEQTRKEGEISFIDHVVLNKDASKNPYGVQFSQVHALDLVDIDGDGVKDVVTGKRFWAHGKGGPDPESDGAPAVLYWFKIQRLPKHQAEFIPYLVDSDSGVGTQVLAADVNGDRYPDIIVGNKKGVFVFEQRVREVSQAEWQQAQPKPLTGAK